MFEGTIRALTDPVNHQMDRLPPWCVGVALVAMFLLVSYLLVKRSQRLDRREQVHRGSEVTAPSDTTHAPDPGT